MVFRFVKDLFLLSWVKLFAGYNSPRNKINQHAREGCGKGGEGVN